jgi:predicted nucleic acid-binding protein
MQHPSEIVIIDTGFIVALFNERDEHHKLVKLIAEQIDGCHWYTTSFFQSLM